MNESTTDPRRRRTGVLWAGSAIAAAILLLAVNGTLSSWTSAIIDNPDNSVAVKGAVALVETDGAHTCDTSGSATNQANCTSINKYGGTAVALDPDGANFQSATVNLKNTGTSSGVLELSSDTCASSAVPSSTGADPVGHPVCGQVTVTVSCDAPASLDTTTSPVVLSSFTGGSPLTVGTLAPGDATNCTFTLTLPPSTPSSYSSQVATQALHWTLTAS